MSNRKNYFDILCGLDLIAHIPNIETNLGLLKYKQELENLLNDFCCKENLISDGFNTKFKHLEQKKGTGIFSMDVGLASSEYVEMLHWNHVGIPIQKGDLMIALHVDAPNVINNQNNLTIRELFVNGLIRAQEEIIHMSPRPQYITCFSHLATKLSKKYSIFANYSMNDIFQQQSGANKYIFRTYELLGFGREDVLKEKLNQLKNSSIKFAPYGRQKIKNEIAIHKAAIALRKKYSPGDISFAVASVHDFIAHPFS